MTLLTPAGPETRHKTSIPIAKPPQRPACSNRDTDQSNTATVGRRHTTLTLMEHAGVPISIISKWAGHYDSSFTMKTYVHASDDDLKQGRQALARIHRLV